MILDLTSATYQSLERIYLFPFSVKIFSLHNVVANHPRSGRGAAVYGTLGGLRGIFTEATNFGPSPAAALPAGHCRNSKYFGNTEQTQRVTRPQYTVAQRSLIPKNIYSKKTKTYFRNPNPIPTHVTSLFQPPACTLRLGRGTRTASANK